MDHPDPLCLSDNQPLLAQSSVLYAETSQYQRMAAAVGTIIDMQVLDHLAKGYVVLAEQREAAERAASLSSLSSTTIQRKTWRARCPALNRDPNHVRIGAARRLHSILFTNSPTHHQANAAFESGLHGYAGRVHQHPSFRTPAPRSAQYL